MGGIQDKIISLDLEKVKEIQLLETGDIFLNSLASSSVVEPRAEEPKLNCLPDPEPGLRIVAPALFYLPKT